MQPSTWRARARHNRAQRALKLNIVYQQRKSQSIAGHEQTLVEMMRKHSDGARTLVEMAGVLPAEARVLEVGSGAHGLIFFFPAKLGVGIDPCAVEYAPMFPRWQRLARTCAAFGEQLPFGGGSFDVVLCDNVIDHAERPFDI